MRILPRSSTTRALVRRPCPDGAQARLPLPSGFFGFCNGLRERRQFHADEIGLVAVDVSEMEEEFHFAPALPGENADTYRLFLLHVFPAQVFENETGLADFVFWPCLFETRLQVMLGSSMTEIKGRIEREGMSFISGRSNADRDMTSSCRRGSSPILRSPTVWFALAVHGPNRNRRSH